MKLLEKVSTKTIVSIDVETVRIQEKYSDLNEAWQAAWEYKQKNNGVVPDFEELSVLWEQQASLYAEFSKVCAVSLVFLDKTGETLMCKEFFGTDERTILEPLGDFLNRIQQGNKEYRLVGHASNFFDFPVLCKRFVINGLDLPVLLDTNGTPPWEQKNIDTNTLWKMGGTGAGSSLLALCTVLGIPTSKEDLVGDEVGKAYFNGELVCIGRYCSYDTIATFNIIRKFKKEPIFMFDDVKYLDEETKQEKTPLLNAIYNQGGISEDHREQILETAKGLTKKEKEGFITLIKASLVRTVKEGFTPDEESLFAAILTAKKTKK